MIIEYVNALTWLEFLECRYINDAEDIWRSLSYGRASSSSYWQMRYCDVIKDREEMWRALIANNVYWHLREYYKFIKDRPEIKKALRDIGKPKC